jgi:hypothetical protein
MVRYNGIIMTETRYRELMQEQEKKKKSLMARLNLMFFGEEKIPLFEWVCFYGVMIWGTVVTMLCLLLTIVGD